MTKLVARTMLQWHHQIPWLLGQPWTFGFCSRKWWLLHSFSAALIFMRLFSQKKSSKKYNVGGEINDAFQANDAWGYHHAMRWLLPCCSSLYSITSGAAVVSAPSFSSWLALPSFSFALTSSHGPSLATSTKILFRHFSRSNKHSLL